MFVDALLILGLAGSQGPHTDATTETRLRYTVQIQSAPATQRERLRETYEALKAKGPFPTVLGELSFNEKGDITRPDYIMYEWRKGDDGKYSYFAK